MKQLCLSAVIDLPDDLFEASEVTLSVKVPWYAALQQLKEKQVEFKHSQEVLEVRPKAKTTRKQPRLVPVNPEAA